MIWVIGSTEMLGAEVCRTLEKEKMQFIATADDVDTRDFKTLKDFADKWETQNYFAGHQNDGSRAKINWIINCSEYSAKNSVVTAKNIARVARACGAKLIHISNDYALDGTATTPCETEIQKTMTQFFILRTTWLYGFNRPNFVRTMAKLMNTENEIKVVSDQRGAPTFTVDLATAILKLIKISDKAGTDIFSKNSISYGIYDFTNIGEVSRYEFSLEIQRLLLKHKRIQNKCNILPCTTEEFGSKAPLPVCSTLHKEKIISALKIKIPKWQDSLEKFIKDSRFDF